MAWRKDGLQHPDKVNQTTQDYYDSQGQLGEFIETCVVEDQGGSIKAGDLYGAYRQYCNYANVPLDVMLSQTELGERMGQMYKRVKSGGARVYRGIKINEPMLQWLLSPDRDRPFAAKMPAKTAT